MNQLQNIQITELHHHPNNPRLDLGDLSELAESIKARGVMQNLTVVPRFRDMTTEEYMEACEAYKANPTEEGRINLNMRRVEEGYNVIIGNRRMEAAKLAGLTSLPCIVADMTEKEQLSTMLLENMQRTDLTIYEQAQGFQMMMDLGMTAKEISSKTGFSDATVRQRIKLCQFSKDQFKSACDHGATLLDFVELAKVEDEAKRTKLLADNSDPARLRTAVQAQLRDQERQKIINQIEPKLKAFAQPLEQRDTWSAKYDRKVEWNINEVLRKFSIPEDNAKVKYYYYISPWAVGLYTDAKKKPVTEAEKQAKEREKKRKHFVREAQEYSKANASFRQMFVEKFTPTKAQLQTLQSITTRLALEQKNPYGGELIGYHCWEEKEFRFLLDMPKEEGRSAEESMWEECHRRNIPEGRALLAWMLCGGIYSDSLTNGYYDNYNGSHCGNKQLDKIYELLCTVGYHMNSCEIQMQNGTHKCFKREVE